MAENQPTYGEPVVDTTRGDSLIYEHVHNMLIKPLQAESVVLANNPLIIDSSEPVRIPTLTRAFNPAWVGENELIPEDTGEFGELRLMPTERKSIKTIVRVSNELIRMARTGVSAVLQTRLVADVKDKLDTALLLGDGADDTVTGLLNQPGHLAGTFDAKDPDSVLDGLALMAGKEIQPTALFMSGADFYTMRKVKDNSGRAVLQPDVTAEAVYRLHGMSVTVTNKLEPGTAILADMSKVAVVRDLEPRVDILTERYAEYDQVGIRVRARYDMGVLHPEAVAVLGGGA